MKTALQIQTQLATQERLSGAKEKVRNLAVQLDTAIMELQTATIGIKKSDDSKEGIYEPAELVEAIKLYNETVKSVRVQLNGYKKITAAGILSETLEP
jgi:hypothetical protein